MNKAKYLVFVGIGLELFAYTMAGIYLGQYADQYLGTAGLMTALLIFIFGGFWFYRIMMVLKKINRNLD